LNHLLACTGGDEPRSEIAKRRGGDDGLGECGKALHEMIASLRIKFRECVVEQKKRRFAAIGGQQLNLRKKKCKKQAALLSARCDRRKIFFVSFKRQVITVWADQRVSLITLALRGFVKRSA
jgi:hypothetical protein